MFHHRAAYRRCMASIKGNPARFPYSQSLTFRDWLDLPF